MNNFFKNNLEFRDWRLFKNSITFVKNNTTSHWAT